MADQILLTGANGFVGRRLHDALRDANFEVRWVVRSRYGQCIAASSSQFLVDNIDSRTCWDSAFNDVGYVVHLAARVHIMREDGREALSLFREVNVKGTACMARNAAAAGVRRFIFLSTVKVNGEKTCDETSFSEVDTPDPKGAYAISKYEAEQVLFEISRETGMEVVIIRSPLVYGPGVKANFLRLMKWAYSGFPLPLGAVHNRRSLIALDNLVDVIICCLKHPAAANQVFLVSDGEDISTTELLERLGKALGRPARLLPVPHAMLEACLKFMGQDSLATRLCGSLRVDARKVRDVLGWIPRVSVSEGLQMAADWFLQNKSRK